MWKNDSQKFHNVEKLLRKIYTMWKNEQQNSTLFKIYRANFYTKFNIFYTGMSEGNSISAISLWEYGTYHVKNARIEKQHLKYIL